ncbi:hypothetical protein [Roseibium sp.]|uniref:hypothetical protein n=1 Tax=Roseibium sp. TaxID=1936156 RepID=UPI003D124C7C
MIFALSRSAFANDISNTVNRVIDSDIFQIHQSLIKILLCGEDPPWRGLIG